MVNIKSYKDGNRLLLVVENCTGETAAKVNSFIADLLGTATEPEAVPAIEPMEVKTPPPPKIPDAEIKEAAPFKETKEKPKPTRDLSLLDQIDTETADSRDFERFIAEFGDSIKPQTQAIINMSGYASVDDFISFASEDEIRDALAMLMQVARDVI